MKRTRYSFMTGFSYTNFKETYRRVLQDEKGEFFIKHNGQIMNVTKMKDKFIED